VAIWTRLAEAVDIHVHGIGRAVQSAGFWDQEANRKWYSRPYQRLATAHELRPEGTPEERVVWRERYQAQHFDFRGKIIFARFDCCEFVKCTLLIDGDTRQLAFTKCVFKDCNVDGLESHQDRGVYMRDNFIDRPLAERRAEFEARLAQALTRRKAKA